MYSRSNRSVVPSFGTSNLGIALFCALLLLNPMASFAGGFWSGFSDNSREGNWVTRALGDERHRANYEAAQRNGSGGTEADYQFRERNGIPHPSLTQRLAAAGFCESDVLVIHDYSSRAYTEKEMNPGHRFRQLIERLPDPIRAEFSYGYFAPNSFQDGSYPNGLLRIFFSKPTSNPSVIINPRRGNARIVDLILEMPETYFGADVEIVIPEAK